MNNTTKPILAIDIGSQAAKASVKTPEAGSVYLGSSRYKKTDGYKQKSINDINVKAIAKNVLGFIYKGTKDFGIEIDDIEIVATAGLRNAPKEQQEELLSLIKNETQRIWDYQLDINIIDGDKEADLTIKGIFANLKPKDNYAIVIDSGGMSTEVSYIKYSKDGKHQIIKSASIDMGNKNFNQQTYQSVFYEALEKLELGDVSSAEVIMTGDTVHLFKSKKETSISDLEGLSKNVGFIKKRIDSTIEYKEKNPEARGFERALIIQEILKHLKTKDSTTATTTFKGVKDGLLIEMITKYENTLSFEGSKDLVEAVKKEIGNWKVFGYKRKQEVSYEVKDNKNINVKIKDKNDDGKIEIDYKIGDKKIDAVIKTDAKNKNNDKYIKQMVLNAKYNGMDEAKLSSNNSKEFNEKLEFYARAYGMKIFVDGKEKPIDKKMKIRLDALKQKIEEAKPVDEKTNNTPIANTHDRLYTR